jgi:molecular chaperone GrpE
MRHKKEEGKEAPKKKTGAAESPAEVRLADDEYETLRKKAEERDEYYNRWLKVHAEYENTRKRIEKEKWEHMKFANENLVSQLFPIVDNFDLALAAMEKAKDKTAVMDGIKMVQKEFHRIIEENGVEKIKTIGEDFDPNIHDAVSVVETDEHPDGIILEEVRAGYTLNKRLLRPAQVIIAKNDSKDTERGGENG